MEQGELQETANIGRGLPEFGERCEVRIAGIRVARRGQRPSGGKASLQRELPTTGQLALLGSIAVVAIGISLFASSETTGWWTDRDSSILGRFVDFRNSPLTSSTDGVAVLGPLWFCRVLRIGTLAAPISIRRFRHFFAVLPAFDLVRVPADSVQIGRPRPFVPVIGDIG